jgi:hypothetical protein
MDEHEPTAEAALTTDDAVRDERGRFQKGNAWAFKPGQTGNPNGRRGSFVDLLRRQGDQPFPGDPGGRTYAEVGAERVWKAICEGDVRAFAEVRDTLFGRPAQTLRLGPASLSDEELIEQIRQLPAEELQEFLSDIAGGRLLLEGANGNGS